VVIEKDHIVCMESSDGEKVIIGKVKIDDEVESWMAHLVLSM
jgi:hypothetical protein